MTTDCAQRVFIISSLFRRVSDFLSISRSGFFVVKFETKHMLQVGCFLVFISTFFAEMSEKVIGPSLSDQKYCTETNILSDLEQISFNLCSI